MKPKTFKATAIAMATAAMLISTGLQAGVIDNSNNTAGKLGACGDDDTTPTACVGAWNLDNVEVSLIKALSGTVFGEFLETVGLAPAGTYTAMAAGDSFVSSVKDTSNNVVAKVSGKIWPVGEPTGIKAVNGDNKVSNGKPQNCLINTAYLGENPEVDGDVDQYLDDNPANPVICSSFFQSHKRFKIAMQPATVEGVTSGEGKPIDLVFNVKDGGGLQPYQVFSKINNYTGKRLQGYKIVVGTGIGSAFVPAGQPVVGGRPAIADKLHLSLGLGEGATKTAGVTTLDGSDLFDGDGLATFSHGLFGLEDAPRFPDNGFFDTRTAGFNAEQACSEVASKADCSTYPNPYSLVVPTPDPLPAPLLNSDTIVSTTKLESNYTTMFGDWLPMVWQPKGIFFDTDGDPTTDAKLMAYWDGSNWRKNNDSGFAVVDATEFSAWKADPAYAIDDIEDVLNLGINYIVKVGDNIDGDDNPETSSTITIRILPVVAADQTPPAYVGTTPTPLVDDGGGCSASTSQRPVDPVLPLLAALGLAGWALRRARRS